MQTATTGANTSPGSKLRKPVLVASLKPYNEDPKLTRLFFRLRSDLAERTELKLIRKSEKDPNGYSVALKGYIQDMDR